MTHAARSETGVGRTYRQAGWLERLGVCGRSFAAATGLNVALKPLFHRLLGWIARVRLVATLPGGERIRVDPANRQLAWNAEEYTAFKEAVRPGATVLDVGANLGAYTVLFARWVGSRGRVIAFEPAPASRAGLARQLELNEAAGQVIVRPEAVSAATGTGLFHADGMQGSNRLLPRRAGGAGIGVATTSLDEFCAREGLDPDVIKIDVEGAELDALRGARHTIARRGAALALFIELHPSAWPRLGVTRADVEAELRAQGLTLERIDGGGDPWSIEGVCLRVLHFSERSERATRAAAGRGAPASERVGGPGAKPPD
jgi:FkbM family methyltransferase